MWRLYKPHRRISLRTRKRKHKDMYCWKIKETGSWEGSYIFIINHVKYPHTYLVVQLEVQLEGLRRFGEIEFLKIGVLTNPCQSISKRTLFISKRTLYIQKKTTRKRKQTYVNFQANYCKVIWRTSKENLNKNIYKKEVTRAIYTYI